MNDLVKHIDNAYKYLSQIPVTGDAIDLAAMARNELRQAYKLASEEEQNGQTD